MLIFISELPFNVITGKVASTTEIICVSVAEFPASSVTVQVTVVSPKAKVLGALLAIVTLPLLSFAVALPSATTTSSQEFANEFIVTSFGAVIVGFVKSFVITVIVLVQPNTLVRVTIVSPWAIPVTLPSASIEEIRGFVELQLAISDVEDKFITSPISNIISLLAFWVPPIISGSWITSSILAKTLNSFK